MWVRGKGLFKLPYITCGLPLISLYSLCFKIKNNLGYPTLLTMIIHETSTLRLCLQVWRGREGRVFGKKE